MKRSFSQTAIILREKKSQPIERLQYLVKYSQVKELLFFKSLGNCGRYQNAISGKKKFNGNQIELSTQFFSILPGIMRNSQNQAVWNTLYFYNIRIAFGSC